MSQAMFRLQAAEGTMPRRSFPELERLIRRLNETDGAVAPDVTEILAKMAMLALSRDEDPYVLLGVLIEAVVVVLATGVPSEDRLETVAAVRQMLRERLAAHGLD